MTLDGIKSRMAQYAKDHKSIHPKIRGVIIGLLDKACGSKENRYQFAVKLGLNPHSKDWTPGEWYAVSQIVKVDKVNGNWIATEPNFEKIVGLVMSEVNQSAGQVTFDV